MAGPTTRDAPAGFTTVELLVAVLIMGLAVALVLGYFSGGQRQAHHTMTRVEQTRDAALTFAYLRRDLSRLVLEAGGATYPVEALVPPQPSIAFACYDATGRLVHVAYTLKKTNAETYSLERTERTTAGETANPSDESLPLTRGHVLDFSVQPRNLGDPARILAFKVHLEVGAPPVQSKAIAPPTVFDTWVVPEGVNHGRPFDL